MPRNILSTIGLLMLSAGIVYYLLQPVSLKHEFHGLQRMTEAELETKLATLGLIGESILKVNPQKISKLLEQSPLIEVAKVKMTLLPQAKLSIYIRENEPWAIYRNQVLGDQAQVLIESKVEAVSYQSQAINKIYDDFYQSQSDLVELDSTRSLSNEELKLIKQSHDLINESLDLITSNINNNSELGHIRLIRINRVNNVFFYSNQLKFITGMMDQNLFKRVERLTTVIPKMIELSSREDLAYVDLSLDTDEVLLGKAQEL